jgi:hypothetical protein
MSEIVTQLQLSMAHHTVDGAALPVDHPDHEEPEAGAAARLIPADHPEAPGHVDQQHGQQQQQQHEMQQQQQQQQEMHEPAAEAQQQQQEAAEASSAQPAQQQQAKGQQRRGAHNRKKRPQRQGEHTKHPRFGEPLTAGFRVGELVMGEVVHDAGVGGLRVRLIDHEGVIG